MKTPDNRHQTTDMRQRITDYRRSGVCDLSSGVSSEAPLVDVRDLKKYFPVRRGLLAPREWKKAVDGVSFEIPRGQTLALVGESGSGKTTVGLMVLDLLPPSAGQILYEGRLLSDRDRRERFQLRRRMQVIFQDPYSSLNARLTIRESVTEGMAIHRIGKDARERERRAGELLERVGLPASALDRYPHEFSGGQRQRIAIARALSVEPEFILCDEPTSALDVSVQSQVLNLLRRLQEEQGLTYLFVTHNLGVVEYMADEVCVMEKGRFVERGTVEEIFDRPQEAYTRRLLDSIPSLNPDARRIRAAASL
jgi:ABC-type oligopeptide transport system ATPase subunit